jgi:uncharacterized CHY-type Zn-finger protein
LESPVHTDKRYRCYTCDATFTRFADKRRHEKKHQLFMISCTHCSRSFYRRDKFRDHCRKTHGLDSPVCWTQLNPWGLLGGTWKPDWIQHICIDLF